MDLAVSSDIKEEIEAFLLKKQKKYYDEKSEGEVNNETLLEYLQTELASPGVDVSDGKLIVNGTTIIYTGDITITGILDDNGNVTWDN